MSARRAARAHVPEPGASIDGVAVPPELLDGSHPVWREAAAYRDWLANHGLARMPAADRLVDLAEWLNGATGAHPANRRNLAAEEWAAANRIALDTRFTHPRADWHALRRLGLID